MNLNIMYEHFSKLEIIVYKKLNAERSKIIAKIFLDIFVGIPGGLAPECQTN